MSLLSRIEDLYYGVTSYKSLTRVFKMAAIGTTASVVAVPATIIAAPALLPTAAVVATVSGVVALATSRRSGITTL